VKTYLRMGSDHLEDAVAYRSKTEAIDAFYQAAAELDRYGQAIEASLHYASSKEALAEYPDFTLRLGTRGNVICERT
jgi:hypothetical protein